jgi:hypothetical protein
MSLVIELGNDPGLTISPIAEQHSSPPHISATSKWCVV